MALPPPLLDNPPHQALPPLFHPNPPKDDREPVNSLSPRNEA